LFELLVFDQISSFFEKNNLLNISQFGFRKGKSTTDAIDKLVHDVLSAFENKVFAQATLCDLCKAFDCVNHSDLLMKLKHYGVQGLKLEFFRSYLDSRKQKVWVNGIWSEVAEVEYGVPQGSVLGPLLFLISINDLPDFMKCKTYLYADDTTFVNINENINKLEVLAKSALERASDWFKTNGFLLSEDKTKHIIFTLKPIDNNLSLKNYDNQVKFLGLHIDKNLTWGSHVDYISSRLSRVIFLIKKLTNCVEQNYVRTAYFSFFQSIFRYGLIFYGNCSRIDEILILQKKILRIMSGASFMDHCKPFFIKLKIQTIINLYIFDLVIYSLKNPTIIKNIAHNYNTRTRKGGHTKIDFYRLNKTCNSHIVVSLKVYNKLSQLINNFERNVFCSKFYDWLLANPFYSIDEFFNISTITFDSKDL
jgi:ribonuclease P/MRP protein subunit RPP40